MMEPHEVISGVLFVAAGGLLLLYLAIRWKVNGRK